MSSPQEGFILHDANQAAPDYLNADTRAGTTRGGKESLIIDQAGLKITGFDPNTGAPQPGWGPVGKAFTVTYAFRSTAPSTMPSGTVDFARFNAQQIYQTEQALQAWSDVTNITFTRVGAGTTGDGAYSNNATILFGGYGSGSSGSAAFAYFPGSTAASSTAGDVWINVNSGSNPNPTIGNYAAQVLVHEIGHSIGLLHPGDYDARSDLPFSYANDAEYFQDSRQYTVLSYFSERNTGANYGGLYASAPQLDDIRAAQYEYGFNMTTRTGDTVYGFGSTADRPWFSAVSSSSKLIFAVWDAGGNDTFNFSGFTQAQLIDMRGGHFSDVGGLVGNVAIAQGVSIENAIGGSGGDTLQANDLDNRLEGRDGDDVIDAEGGNDTIFGGAGNDIINTGDGANVAYGEDGDDDIDGGVGADTMNGNVGNDTLSGGINGDVILGGKNDDSLSGDDGDDFLNGNLGSDTVEGGAGADSLLGGQGDDNLSGGSGNDYLSGDRGNDTLVGGLGADVFRGFVGSGVDRVVDFFFQDEGDRIFLEGGVSYTVQQSGQDTVVTIGTGGDQIILVNVQMSTLTAGWIVA